MSADSDPRIRWATADEIPAIARAFPRRLFLAERFRRQTHGRGVLLIAWWDERPVGVLYLWLEPAEEPELRQLLPGVPLLMHLEVRSDHQNNGVGTALVGAAEALLLAQGHERVALGVRPHNGGAARLYRRLGYTNWPYPDIETRYETVTEAGEIVHGREMCQILTKELVEKG